MPTVVISFASNQRSARSRSLGGVVEPHTPEAQFEEPYGPLYPASYYAMAAGQYLHTLRRTTREELAEVAVAAREWALLNPAAFRHEAGPLTVDDVLAAPMVSTPLTVADCCLVTDGGGAVVLTSLERARDLPQPPVVVLGYGERTTNASMTAVDDLTVHRRRRVGRGGLRPGRAHARPTSTSPRSTTRSRSPCCSPWRRSASAAPARRATAFVARIRRRCPLNTSGGGLSYCHPGQFGVLLLVEAVRQLRGECGARQVAGAEVALAHGTGGILSTHATVLLGVDR